MGSLRLMISAPETGSMAPETSFEVDVSPEIDPGQALLVGLATPGMASVTAADYVVRHLDSTEIGHVSPDTLPAITPVQGGEPRHHTRLYNLDDVDLTVLVGELFVPIWAARSFAETLFEWISTQRIEEITVMHAVPFPHGPEEHVVFYAATDAYREQRIEGTDIRPLGGGFLDGVPGELTGRSIGGDAPPVGTFVTPAHPPGPDVDAALLLLDAIETVYDVPVDLTELEDLSDTIRQHYATLGERMETLRDTRDSLADREFYEDRMFM